ncbi:[FeFe] hydrogenase H-cluster radical SAM maturase HydG [Paramaledivibacter caminithermalis]|uniref:Iron-only hydrogenase maturation protein HydG n=1 Tax=Paramaledivibacter caminithermalis (strain DSM 15212 / CIP 107654 / DViRD3) TaxID=1121301 RepID=A0A1M6LYJ8_PARC5|nr:[FeFe] hydrogenase H-cluster radical SAM maturase HydG [Paramaledivibacter caminithermalis]SHJ76242.1 iron-only hydrogenase maturation protein HydG [Paramaledivibacter caminithermalis DSM 15212]
MATMSVNEWANQVIKQSQIDKYLINGKDFINEKEISEKLKLCKNNDKNYIRNIIEKSKSIETLTPDEVASLLNVTDNDLWEEMYEAGAEIKRKVYDNRIVFFAPLYCSNLCVNGCKYCGFRTNNKEEKRRILNMDEIKKETEFVVDEGHKRMIVVYGEHPLSDIDYMCESIKAVYDVKKKSPNGNGYGNIRRVNVNAAPMSTEDLVKLKNVGIGTYQVFQETYNRNIYKELHPFGPKSDYRWRLYALHRAMDAGIDDLAIGALFGLYDWKFEVMGLIYHALDLEKQFGIGPHTISFPRLMPASGTSFFSDTKYLVNNDEFKKLVTVLRLAVPYTGLIITARESPEVRDEVINVGCTQIDASTRIGVGGYSENNGKQYKEKQQFMLGDTRSLDEMIKILAKKDTITSFCTAGYRCGRTGDKIMGLLKGCVEGKFCKLNAVLTFKEYLEDYASPETKIVGEKVIQKEIDEISNLPFFKEHGLYNKLMDYYNKISKGERDVYL